MGAAGDPLFQKLLLVTDHHAWSAETHPSDDCFRIGALVSPSDVGANQRTSATQPCPAVDSHGAMACVDNLAEAVYDRV